MIGMIGLVIGLACGIPIGMMLARDIDAGAFDRPFACDDPPATARALRRRRRAMRADLRRAMGRKS